MGLFLIDSRFVTIAQDKDKLKRDDFLGKSTVDLKTVFDSWQDRWIVLKEVASGKLHLTMMMSQSKDAPPPPALAMHTGDAGISGPTNFRHEQGIRQGEQGFQVSTLLTVYVTLLQDPQFAFTSRICSLSQSSGY